MRRTHALLFVCFAIACDATVQEHTILTGWNVTWGQLSHRIAYLETTLQADALQLGMIGGNWSTGEAFSDTPTYRVRHSTVESRAAHFVDGESELVIGPDGSATTTATVPLDALPRHGKQVAVLRGFAYDTDIEGLKGYPEDYDPGHGYTLVAQGVAFSSVKRQGDEYVFEVQATFETGPADREDMNGAMPFAQVAATVSWTLIGFEGHLETATVTGEQPLSWTPPYSHHDPLFDALPLEIKSRYPKGIIGWRAFMLSQQNDENSGEYIRAMGAEIVPTSTPADHGFTGNAEAIYSNSSLSEFHQIDMAFYGEVIWMGLADGDAEITHQVVEIEADTLGLIETDLNGN